MQNKKAELSRFNEMQGCNKIKLRKVEYHLLHEVCDLGIVGLMVCVGKGEPN